MSQLPVELWRAVLEQLVDDSCALARVCLTSKSFLSIAQPRLYRYIRLEVFKRLTYWDTFILCRRHLESFRANPRLRPLVRSLHFIRDSLSKRCKRSIEGSEAVGQLLELLPSVEIVCVDKLRGAWQDIDAAIARYQIDSNAPRHLVAIQRRPIAFRFKLFRDSYVPRTTSCNGAYEEFDCRTTSSPKDGDFTPASFLSQSFGTLRSLSISLHDNLDLAPFHILESLCLELSIGQLACVIPTLVQVVPPIESLVSLSLVGTIPAGDLTTLVTRGRIIDCLGPNVVSVSLEWQLLFDELISLARSIPSTSSAKHPTSLKRFTCLPVEIDASAGICSDDDVEEYEKERSIIAVDEFRKRGIELRFDATRVLE